MGMAICARIHRCQPANLAQELVGADLNACAAVMQAPFAAELGAPGARLTAAELEDCASKRDAAPCGAAPAPCTFSPGALADGTPCRFPSQCASGHCRVLPDGMAAQPGCGLCAPRLAAGAKCDGDHDCAPGLACSAASFLCAAPPAAPALQPIAGAAAGASCGGDGDCGDGLYCASGSCAALTVVAPGAACDATRVPASVCAGELLGAACVAGTCVVAAPDPAPDPTACVKP